MKKVLLTLLALQCALFAGAQQDAQFSQNRFVTTAYNPGAVGIKGVDCIKLLHRQQWFGFEGAPQTTMLSYEGTLSEYNSGFGGVLVYDVIGFETNVFVKGNYAYHFELANGAKIGAGIDVGLISKTLNGNWVAGVMTDPYITAVTTSQSALNFDLGLGAFYYTKDFYFGISGQKLVPQKVKWGAATPKIAQHMYFMGGYNYAIGANKDIILKPSFLVKTDLVTTQLDVNLMADYKDMWLGASYRIQDAIVAMAGYNIPLGSLSSNPLKVGLAYDFTTQGLKEPADYFDPEANQYVTPNRSRGSIELFLGYCFVKPEKPNFPHYVDPLFLNN